MQTDDERRIPAGAMLEEGASLFPYNRAAELTNNLQGAPRSTGKYC
jgi:hypothetical protein